MGQLYKLFFFRCTTSRNCARGRKFLETETCARWVIETCDLIQIDVWCLKASYYTKSALVMWKTKRQKHFFPRRSHKLTDLSWSACGNRQIPFFFIIYPRYARKCEIMSTAPFLRGLLLPTKRGRTEKYPYTVEKTWPLAGRLRPPMATQVSDPSYA